MKKPLLLFTIFLLTVVSEAALAQLPVSVEYPRASPKETRSITIGYTTISFEYSSVGIKGREIWGELVPYGRVWRTGANENTLFTVTDDVLVNGEKLKAGTYGLHTIPGEEEWILIFSNFSEAWGSYFYDESEDALRITVSSEEMDSKYEWMKFSFSNYTSTSVDISLKWAHLKVPFKVEIPMETTFANLAKQFRTLPAFGWQGWVQGATYLQNNDYKLDVALDWANRGLQRERNVQTAGLHAKLLVLNGKKEEGLKAASEMTKEWADDWRSYYSAAEIYEVAEDVKQAKKAYKKAIDIAGNDRTKAVLQRRLDALEN